MAGSIQSYETAQGKRYRVRYRKPDKTQTDKRGFRTKREAELYLASITVSKATGQYIDPTAGRVTIAHLGPNWLAKKAGLKPSSYRPLELAWRVYVLPKWGRVAASDVTASDVEAWITQLSAGKAPAERLGGRANGRPLSASSVLRAVGVLAGILDDAKRDGRIHGNPARGAENLPRKTGKAHRRYLTDVEVMSLAGAIADPTRSTLVVLLAYTGLRWSEAIGLRVRDLNMLRRRLHVRRPVVEIDGVFHEGEPKSWERRTVAFPAFLDVALAAICIGKGPDDTVFSDGLNYLRQPHAAKSWFLTGLRAAGVERLTPHDLRHTAASLAVSAGANVKVLQRMLGHKSAAMTLDTYADLFDDDLDNVASLLDARATSAADVGKVWADLGIRAS